MQARSTLRWSRSLNVNTRHALSALKESWDVCAATIGLLHQVVHKNGDALLHTSVRCTQKRATVLRVCHATSLKTNGKLITRPIIFYGVLVESTRCGHIFVRETHRDLGNVPCAEPCTRHKRIKLVCVTRLQSTSFHQQRRRPYKHSLFTRIDEAAAVGATRLEPF